MKRILIDTFINEPNKRKKATLFDLTEEQEKIMEDIRNGKNVYITGDAGTGKTMFLKNIIREFKYVNSKNILVTASTGIAAQHISGVTIHSTLNRDDLHTIDVLIIDEASMLSPHYILHVCNIFARKRRCAKPFGGVQVIMSGDNGQLKPINGIISFYESGLIDEFNFLIRPLTVPFRQTDPYYLNILKELRTGEISKETLMALQKRLISGEHQLKEPLPVHIFSRREVVEDYNKVRLALLSKEVKEFNMDISPSRLTTAEQKCVNYFVKNHNIHATVKIAVGARIIITSNISQTIVNGMQGTITDIEKNGIVRIIFDNGIKESMRPHTWNCFYHKYGKGNKNQVKRISIKQYPFELGWALTSHKCQGSTFNSIVTSIDETIFAKNQIYTILSRVRTLDDLYLLSLDTTLLKVK